MSCPGVLGAVQFTRSLEGLTELTELRLVGCMISDEAVSEVQKACQLLPAIETVDLHDDGAIPLSRKDWRHFTQSEDG